MSYWAKAPQSREQLVLFANRLDEILPADHTARLLDAILSRIDWSSWEATYHGRLGQPPIHPRVLASVLLYGLLKRIRSSRALEEALEVRIDFKWLAEGHRVDHTTLSEFRRRHGEALKDLFVQVGLVARTLDLLPLVQLAFDGTRLRSNNRRSGSRTPEKLRQMREELAEKFAELEAQAEREDATESRQEPPLPQELADTQRRLAEVDAALEELRRVEAAGETIPKRIPLTDPQSRVTPNKDGGFAPNYTPLATVDTEHGFIVATDVIAMTDEDHYLVAQLEQVKVDFDLERLPAEVLADGMMASGANLEDLETREVTLYSPIAIPSPTKNPALRANLSQSVAVADWDRLPSKPVTCRSGEKQQQLTKEAFVYDAPKNCYWCPAGEQLTAQQTTSERCGSGRLVRTRYKAKPSVCAVCPLRDRCLQRNAKAREVSRFAQDGLKEQLAERMAQPESQAKYRRRREVGERPFAVIKQQFGARQFLLRGLKSVRIEWGWLTTAFNLERLISILRSRAGPATRMLS